MPKRNNRIAIIGAGIQGCSIAMELVQRGCEVVLVEGAAEPMSRSSRWNEGKIHLGYVYGLDTSLKTANLMVQGAFEFLDFFKTHLGDSFEVGLSSDFTYLVKNDSMISPEAAGDYFNKVDSLVQKEIERGRNYLGRRELKGTTRMDAFPDAIDSSQFLASYQTPELSIDTQKLVAAVVGWVKRCPAVTLVTRTRVNQIVQTKNGTFRYVDSTGRESGEFDEVVNASWESRLRLDESLGLAPPERRWLHRYKLSVHLKAPFLEDLPSATMILGKFGDIVNYRNGSYYLNWYPVGKIGQSDQLQPPGDFQLSAEEKRTVAEQTIQELARLFPPLRSLDLNDSEFAVEGGFIFAWGDKDVDDAQTDLHRRYETGVHSRGRYHSVDTGKLTTAPLFARECASRILL